MATTTTIESATAKISVWAVVPLWLDCIGTRLQDELETEGFLNIQSKPIATVVDKEAKDSDADTTIWNRTISPIPRKGIEDIYTLK